MTCAADGFFDGDRLAGHQRFVDRTFAVEHDAVDRNFFAGANAKAVADLRRARAARRVRCRRRARAARVFGDRLSSARMAVEVWLRARSSKYLPEQDERRDRGGSFEVNRHCAVVRAETQRGKVAGTEPPTR